MGKFLCFLGWHKWSYRDIYRTWIRLRTCRRCQTIEHDICYGDHWDILWKEGYPKKAEREAGEIYGFGLDEKVDY